MQIVNETVFKDVGLEEISQRLDRLEKQVLAFYEAESVAFDGAAKGARKAESALESMTESMAGASKEARNAQRDLKLLGQNGFIASKGIDTAKASVEELRTAQRELEKIINNGAKSVNRQKEALQTLQNEYNALDKAGKKSATNLRGSIGRLQKAIKSNQLSLADLRLEYAELNIAAKDAAARQQKFGDTIKLNARDATNLGYQLNDLFVQIASGQGVIRPLVQQGPQITQIFGGAGTAMRYFRQQTVAALKSVFSLRGGLKLLGRTSILLVLTALVSVVVELNRRTRFLHKIGKGISATFDVLAGRAAKVGAALIKIFSGDVRKGLQELKASMSGIVDEISRATTAAIALDARLKALANRRQNNEVSFAETRRQREELRAIYEDETRTLAERAEARRKEARIEAGLYEEARRIAQAQLDTTREKVKTDVAAGKKVEELLAQQAEEQIELANIVADKAEATRVAELDIQELYKQSAKVAEKSAKDIEKANDDLAKAIAAIRKRLQDEKLASLEGLDQINYAEQIALQEIDALEQVTKAKFAEAKKQFNLEKEFQQLRSNVTTQAEKDRQAYIFEQRKSEIELLRDQLLAQVELIERSADEELSLEQYKATERARIMREGLQQVYDLTVEQFGADSPEAIAVELDIAAFNADDLERIKQQRLDSVADLQAIKEAEIDLIRKSGKRELTLEQYKELKRTEAVLAGAKARREILAYFLGEDDPEVKLLDLDIAGLQARINELNSLNLDPLTRIKESIKEAFNLSEADFQVLAQQVQQAVSNVLDGLQSLREAEIARLDVQIKKSEERIKELEKDLKKELELKEKGYANNVASAQRALDEENRNRREAYEERAEIEKKQARQELIIDAAKQASSLALAAAQLLAAEASKGIIGVALAAAGIASMFALLAKAKAQAAKARADIPVFREGGRAEGVVVGPSHEEGGVLARYTRNGKVHALEIEGGEHITPQGQARRYETVLEAIRTRQIENWHPVRLLSEFGALPRIGEGVSRQVKNGSIQARPQAGVGATDMGKLIASVDELRRENRERPHIIPVADGYVIIDPNRPQGRYPVHRIR